jgi:hypothetical protein
VVEVRLDANRAYISGMEKAKEYLSIPDNIQIAIGKSFF